MEQPRTPLPEDGTPLTGQDVLRHQPPIAAGTEHPIHRDSHAVEECLAELVDVGNGLERPDIYPRVVHVDQERVDSSRARHVLRASQHNAPGRVMGPTCPKFLSRDDPMVAVLGCGCP